MRRIALTFLSLPLALAIYACGQDGASPTETALPGGIGSGAAAALAPSGTGTTDAGLIDVLKSAGKVDVCHIPPGNAASARVINVSANAVPAHLGHGDTQDFVVNADGSCAPSPPCVYEFQEAHGGFFWFAPEPLLTVGYRPPSPSCACEATTSSTWFEIVDVSPVNGICSVQLHVLAPEAIGNIGTIQAFGVDVAVVAWIGSYPDPPDEEEDPEEDDQ